MKKINVLVLLAFATFGMTAMALAGSSAQTSGASAGTDGVDIVGAIFEAGGDAMNFPLDGTKDTNFDFIDVGNDIVIATGFAPGPIVSTANNLLEIKKNQDTQCSCCPEVCLDCCPVNNLEKIRVGNRAVTALAGGQANSQIKILTNQM